MFFQRAHFTRIQRYSQLGNRVFHNFTPFSTTVKNSSEKMKKQETKRVFFSRFLYNRWRRVFSGGLSVLISAIFPLSLKPAYGKPWQFHFFFQEGVVMALDETLDIHARIAVYDDLISAPRIIDVEPSPIVDFIEAIASGTYEHARAKGGRLPYTVIREIAENFIHAEFKECTVSVLDDGNTVRFSDQGPGIQKKELVLQPGVSSATSSMKQYIRGVGSGFPIVREYLELVNGFLSIDDNAIDGTIITLTILSPDELHPSALAHGATRYREAPGQAPTRTLHDGSAPSSRLVSESMDTPDIIRETEGDKAFGAFRSPEAGSLKPREEQALLLLYTRGPLGTGDLVDPLGISAPTATRLFQRLEHLGLVELTLSKKRILSDKGRVYVQAQGQQGFLGQ